MKVSNILKKTCGDKLSKFLSLNFNQDSVIKLIQKIFNNNGRDIKHIMESQFQDLKQFLNIKAVATDEDYVEVDYTATELLNDNGYNLYRVKTKAEASEFRKFFKRNELLCKFKSVGVFTQTHVYFIVKQDAENIERFEEPKRQDDYSTSVMSVKVSKDGNNVLQITSRYNHTVSGCDNTHNSNLDNIVNGLSKAFNHEFGYSIKQRIPKLEFKDFVEIDNTMVYYHNEVEGIKVGNYTLVTDRILNFSSNSYYMYNHYLINLADKKIVWDEYFESKDAFVEYFNNTVKKIEFVKDINTVDDNNQDDICYIQK